MFSIHSQGLCIADFNETTGNKTLRELAEEFGEDRVMFVKCDVTSQSEFEGNISCYSLFIREKKYLGLDFHAWDVINLIRVPSTRGKQKVAHWPVVWAARTFCAFTFLFHRRSDTTSMHNVHC